MSLDTPCPELNNLTPRTVIEELRNKLNEERACHDCDEYRALMRKRSEEKLERVQTELSALKSEAQDKDLPPRTRAAVAYVVERVEMALDGILGCTHDTLGYVSKTRGSQEGVTCRACQRRWDRIRGDQGSLLVRHDPKKPWVCTCCGLRAKVGYSLCPRCKTYGSLKEVP